MTPAEMQVFAWSFIETSMGVVFRSLLVACLCGCAVWLLRSRTAELRFRLWKWTLLSLFALPVLINVTPPLRKPSQVISRVESAVLPSSPVGKVTTEYRANVTTPIAQRFPWLIIIPACYVFVTGLLLLRLVFSLRQLHRIAQRSEFIRDPQFRELAHEIWLQSGAFVPARVVVSEDVKSPVTFDAGDPWILLPPNWRLWSRPKLRAVLVHEMAHVQRGDSQTLLLALLATCLFWFHPLSWYLRNQLAAGGGSLRRNRSRQQVHARAIRQFPDRVRTRCTTRWANGGGDCRRGAFRVAAPYRTFICRYDRQPEREEHVACTACICLFLPALYLTAAARPLSLKCRNKSFGPLPSI